MELGALIRGAVADASRNRITVVLAAAKPPSAGAFSGGGIGLQAAPADSNLGERPSETAGVQPVAIRPQPDCETARSGQAKRPAEPPPNSRQCG